MLVVLFRVEHRVVGVLAVFLVAVVLVEQVCLVPDQSNHHIRVTELPDLLQPVPQVEE